MKTVRTRIAPSPTGQDLHIGNVYTALINYVFAKKHNGKFIVRIEDTDRSRFVKGAQERILDSLSWFGLEPDESIERQSERLNLYKKHAEELVKNNHAYYCFCTSDRLAEVRKKQQRMGKPPRYDGRCRKLKIKNEKLKIKEGKSFVIRLAVPFVGTTEFEDVVRGKISFENKLIDDQILLKSDGYPTYHLAVVVDDYLMGISHIIRAEEWISSTPKHVLLYNAFGWKLPVFAHLPLLRNQDKSKLSKRKNPVWASWYREHGFLPEAVLNYLGTLGWSIPSEIIEKNRKDGIAEEIFSIDDMMKHFDLSNIQTSAPIFNITKLEWMNGEHIRKTQNSKLKTQIYEFFNKKYPQGVIEKTVPLVKERMKTLSEYKLIASFFFQAPKTYEQKVNKEWIQKTVEAFSNISWDHETLLSEGRKVADDLGVKFRKLAMDIRIAITGKKVGPPLFESMELLGKEECLKRLKHVL